MSILCAQATADGHVIIASDSRLTRADGEIVPGTHEKWMEIEPGLWLGLAGNEALATAVRYYSAKLSEEKTTAAMTARATFRACEELEWKPVHEGPGPKEHDFDAIIVQDGVVWLVDGTGAFVDVGSQFCAIGCGAPYAIGAVYGLLSPSEDSMFRAINAACANHSACGGDVFVRVV